MREKSLHWYLEDDQVNGRLELNGECVPGLILVQTELVVDLEGWQCRHCISATLPDRNGQGRVEMKIHGYLSSSHCLLILVFGHTHFCLQRLHLFPQGLQLLLHLGGVACCHGYTQSAEPHLLREALLSQRFSGEANHSTAEGANDDLLVVGGANSSPSHSSHTLTQHLLTQRTSDGDCGAHQISGTDVSELKSWLARVVHRVDLHHSIITTHHHLLHPISTQVKGRQAGNSPISGEREREAVEVMVGWTHFLSLSMSQQ